MIVSKYSPGPTTLFPVKAHIETLAMRVSTLFPYAGLCLLSHIQTEALAPQRFGIGVLHTSRLAAIGRIFLHAAHPTDSDVLEEIIDWLPREDPLADLFADLFHFKPGTLLQPIDQQKISVEGTLDHIQRLVDYQLRFLNDPGPWLDQLEGADDRLRDELAAATDWIRPFLDALYDQLCQPTRNLVEINEIISRLKLQLGTRGGSEPYRYLFQLEREENPPREPLGFVFGAVDGAIRTMYVEVQLAIRHHGHG